MLLRQLLSRFLPASCPLAVLQHSPKGATCAPWVAVWTKSDNCNWQLASQLQLAARPIPPTLMPSTRPRFTLMGQFCCTSTETHLQICCIVSITYGRSSFGTDSRRRLLSCQGGVIPTRAGCAVRGAGPVELYLDKLNELLLWCFHPKLNSDAQAAEIAWLPVLHADMPTCLPMHVPAFSCQCVCVWAGSWCMWTSVFIPHFNVRASRVGHRQIKEADVRSLLEEATALLASSCTRSVT